MMQKKFQSNAEAFKCVTDLIIISKQKHMLGEQRSAAALLVKANSISFPLFGFSTEFIYDMLVFYDLTCARYHRRSVTQICDVVLKKEPLTWRVVKNRFGSCKEVKNCRQFLDELGRNNRL